MADISNTPVSPKPGFLARLGLSRKRWASTHVAPAQQITAADAFMYGAGTTTIASLLGSGNKGARARQIIYEKWSMMEGDPIISTALMLLVTSALGGHETRGDLVFIEKKADTKKDKRLSSIVDDISAELTPLFNKVAFQAAYIGGAFGDSYARLYTNSRGVVDIHMDETIRPPMVQPFERGSRTVGFAVYTGERGFERLDVSQMARLKMPRVQWVPQYGVVEKAVRLAIAEDDIDSLPIMPSMVGGSLLYSAEGPYDNLTASLLGLVGQRWMDSIDEQMVAVNLESMNLDQQQRFVESVKAMLMASKAYAEQAVKTGRPVMERIRHIIPVFNEKQLSTVGPANGGAPGRAATISIEDVMLHARMLAGALGVDLSMLGFADQLSGGLGEGGFFRVSAQAAERARIIRVALADFFNHVIDIHTMRRYGVVLDPKERPWTINFFGSISALEAEKQRTRSDSMNAGMLLAQSMQMMKELGTSEEVMVEFLAKTMMLDEDQAKLYASIMKAKLPEETQDGGGWDRGGMDSVRNAATFDSAPDPGLGPVFTEYENDPEGAIERLMSERTGDARAVWTRQGLGTIDLVWGTPKGGLMHIAQKHPEVIARLPRILKTGRIYRKSGARKVFLVVDGTPPEVAVLALDWHGRAKTWVVTTYEDVPGKFAGSLKTMNPDALDSSEGVILSEDQRTGSILGQESAGFNNVAERGEFAGSIKTIDPDALDSTKGVVLSEDPRTAPILDAAALDAVGKMETITIPRRTVEWLGFDGGVSARADLQALAERHSEYYHGDADAVLADIQFVLAAPDDWFIHSGKSVVIFREAVGTGRAPMVRIELETNGKTFVVRSVFQGGKRQIASKMQARRKELERLGLGSHLPGSLSVADYLSALGNGSLRAVPPSGGSPKAR